MNDGAVMLAGALVALGMMLVDRFIRRHEDRG